MLGMVPSLTLYIYKTESVVNNGSPFMRIYGVNEKEESVAINIRGFHSHVYLSFKKTSVNIEDLRETIKKKYNFHECKFVKKKKFLDCHVAKSRESSGHHHHKYLHREFDYVYLSFKHFTAGRKRFINDVTYAESNKYKDQDCLFSSRGKTNYIRIKEEHFDFKMHEHHASPETQFMIQYNLPTTGWVSIKSQYYKLAELKYTSAHLEYEMFSADYIQRDFTPRDYSLKVADFDIETYSDNDFVFPSAFSPKHEIICIALNFFKCTSKIDADNKKREKRYIFTLGNPVNKCSDITKVIYCHNESFLLSEFGRIIQEENPQIITGYNIIVFDIPYILLRAELLSESNRLRGLSMNKSDETLKSTDVILGKNRYSKNQKGKKKMTPKNWLTEGRVTIDLYTFVQLQGFTLPDNKLNTVAKHFLHGEKKDDMEFSQMFKAYRGFLSSDIIMDEKTGKYDVYSDELGDVIKYNEQDVVLVNKLFILLNTYLTISEFANITNTDLFVAYSSGKMKIIYALVLKTCYQQNRVLENDASRVIADKYKGAFVFTPEPSVISGVGVFDFTSLYPTIIIAHNFCPTSLIGDDSGEIDAEDIEVISWKECKNCEHDLSPDINASAISHRTPCSGIRDSESAQPFGEKGRSTGKSKDYSCKEFTYKVLKPGLAENVFPEIIIGLLDARKECKNNIKGNEKQITDLKKSLQKSLTLAALDDQIWAKVFGLLHDIKTENYISNMYDKSNYDSKIKEVEELIIEKRENILSNEIVAYILNRRELLLYLPNKGVIDSILSLERENLILDKKQWSYKTTVNSIYGVAGAGEKGIMQTKPIAMMTTFKGRSYILEVSEFVNRIPGVSVVYGDTDSIFVALDVEFLGLYNPSKKYYTTKSGKKVILIDYKEARSFFMSIEEKIKHLFPKDMSMLFENAIYNTYVPLGKKRYCYKPLLENGEIGEIRYKGMQSIRQDSCGVISKCTKPLLEMLMDYDSYENMTDFYQNYVLNIMSRGLIDPDGSMIEPYAIGKHFITSRKVLNVDEYEGKGPAHSIERNARIQRGEMVEDNERIYFTYVNPHLYRIGKDVRMDAIMAEPNYAVRKGMRLHLQNFVRMTVSLVDEILSIKQKQDQYFLLESLKIKRPTKCMYGSYEKKTCKSKELPMCHQHNDMNYIYKDKRMYSSGRNIVETKHCYNLKFAEMLYRNIFLKQKVIYQNLVKILSPGFTLVSDE